MASLRHRHKLLHLPIRNHHRNILSAFRTGIILQILHPLLRFLQLGTSSPRKQQIMHGRAQLALFLPALRNHHLILHRNKILNPPFIQQLLRFQLFTKRSTHRKPNLLFHAFFKTAFFWLPDTQTTICISVCYKYPPSSFSNFKRIVSM